MLRREGEWLGEFSINPIATPSKYNFGARALDTIKFLTLGTK